MTAALELLHGLVNDDGRLWGEAAVGFQREDARAVLDEAGAPYHFLTRSRGGSKTSDLAAVAVAALLAQLPARARCYALAADRDQARLLLDAVGGYAQRTPGLGGALRIESFRVVAEAGGASLEALAADAPSAWGLRPALVVVDELAWWQETAGAQRLWEAATSAVAKSGGRLVVLTTAGDPAHFSHRVREHALADPLWRVHEVEGPAPWLDAVRVEEQRRLLSDSMFRRLFLNQWAAGEDRLVDPLALRECVTLDGPQSPRAGWRYVVGVDLGLKRDRTAAAVCHAEPERVRWDGQTRVEGGIRVVLDRLAVWQPSVVRPVRLDDVEEWLLTATREYRADVVLDPWQAVGLAQRLRGRGVRVEEFTFSQSSVGRLASTLHLLLRDRRLALPDDADLLDELAHVRLRETSPGVVRMDHDASRHDDRAIALALAAQRLLERNVTAIAAGHWNWALGRRQYAPEELASLTERERIALGPRAIARGNWRLQRR